MADPLEHSETPQPVERLPFGPNLMATLKHIRAAVKAEGDRMRKSDPLTLWLVPGLAVALACVSFSHGVLRILISLLAYLAVLAYILTRIGIVRSLSHRQTNLVWHLLMAEFISGLIFALLVFEIVHH